MRRFRDAVCLLVAVGSIAVAAWQADTTDHSETVTNGSRLRQVEERVPEPIDRAVRSAPLLKA